MGFEIILFKNSDYFRIPKHKLIAVLAGDKAFFLLQANMFFENRI